MSLKRRVAKLVERADSGEAATLRKHWERRFDEREALIDRWFAALPKSRVKAVEAVLIPWVEKFYDPQWWFADPTAPALARWIAWLDGHGWFPDPIPEALIDLFLAHPEASVSSYDCEDCGLTMPSEPHARPYAEACPHCRGRIAYNGYYCKQRITFSSLGKELLAGRDPCRRGKKLNFRTTELPSP